MIKVTDKTKDITVEGETMKECAGKLGISPTMLSYYFYHQPCKYEFKGCREAKGRKNDLFTQRFRSLMKEKRFTRSSFAKESGLALNTVNRYAEGFCLPGAQNLIDICLTLDESADYLLGLSDEKMN